MNNLLKRTISSIIIIILFFFCIIGNSYYFNTLLIFCYSVSFYEWFRLTKNNPLRIFGLIFLTISFFTIYKLSEDVRYLFLVIFICISTDIGGYVFGKILKGPKLIKISPNKTYAGMIGSYVLTLILTPLFLEFLQFNNMSLSRAIIVSFIISSISQMGDIVISFFKRKAKVKNTGKLIPGHGGILDRIDGMIFAVPTFYILNLLQIF